MRWPWTIEFLRKYSPVLGPSSLLRLRSALLAERRGELGFADEITLQLRQPYSTPLTLRPRSNDLCTFDEVLIEGVYGEVLKAIPRIETVLDLGANIGLSAIYFLSRCPGCRVLAVEPDRANALLLKANLAAFGARATVLEAAAWTTEGAVRFAPPWEPGHVNSGAVTTGEDGYDVPAHTISWLLDHDSMPHADLLKMDIEGAEANLFTEPCEWLRRVRCLAIEFHGDSREHSGFDGVVTRHGFRILPGAEHTVVAVREGRL